MNTTLRALNRFGLGARFGERDRISHPKNWLKSQLDPARTGLEDRSLPSLQDIGAALKQSRASAGTQDEEVRRKARQGLQQIAGKEVSEVLSQRVRTSTPFLERLVAFWSNHLCVSARAKPQVLALAGHYERDVIRPHVLGRFSDMVLASARHPAMLFYLDNARSIGPSSLGSRRAARGGRELGLNENYARELLELHTVGVEGGYTQEDVEQLALVLTGWTVAGLGRGRMGMGMEGSSAPSFLFRQALHEPGAKTVLGVRYAEAGVNEGERVIRDLCLRPQTAHFLAGKLVRHFVSDEPPARAVQQIASIYMKTGGDLLQVSAALVDLPEAWEPGNRKFRTPQDWLTAVLRAVGQERVPPRMGNLLRQLRHPLWAPPAPKGYGDSLREWGDPDSLMNRAELGRSLARRLDRGRLEPARMLELVDLAESDPLGSLLADSSIGREERMALSIAGPAFQWR